jgi:O-antigen ligase
LNLRNTYFFPEEGEIKTKANYVLYFTLLAYIVSLFLKDTPVITNLLMIGIFVLSVVQIKSLKQFYNNPVNIGILVFYSYQLISVLLSDNIQSGFTILLFRMPLFILPLAFCFIDFEKRSWDKLLLFYALITTAASIVGFLLAVFKSQIENDTGFLYNDNISVFLGKQSVYFAYYVAIAILVFIIQLKQYPDRIQKHKFLIYFAIAWLLFIIFMLASRTTMFALLFVLFLYMGSLIVKKRKILEGVLLFLSLTIGVVIISKLFPKTLNRFKGTTEVNYHFDNKNVENHFNAEYDSAKWNGTNTRIAVWKCALEIWKTQPILGTGIGGKNEALMKKYEEHGFWYALTTQKNTHNQYIDILLSMGIIGLLVFVTTFFILPIRLFLKQKQTFALIVFSLLACCLFTENMLDRYQGLIFIAFILPLSAQVFNNESSGDDLKEII